MVIVSCGIFYCLGEACVFRSVILVFPLVVRSQILPTTLKIWTHMNRVYAASALTIVQVIVYIGDNYPIFYMGR